MEHKIGNTTFYGELAEAVSKISPDEWDYYSYIGDLSDQIVEYMGQHDISQAELARRLETSRSFVSKILSGDVNMTQKTLVKILNALGAKPKTKIISKTETISWLWRVRTPQDNRVPQCNNFSKIEIETFRSFDSDFVNAA
ncbi:helix-turn-helix domain-containing protein [Solidesulfovibrio sp. C21]|uniref:helix-turn-helix domain-containing protein n=1 Tax=Solidesulfovibrio sp. C21 TaxID=3398613 RepID=UPI0039FCB463